MQEAVSAAKEWRGAAAVILIPILIPLLFKVVSNNSSDNTDITYHM